MIAVCGIGNPKGLRNSATTAYQSARPPMVAASANAATKPNAGCAGSNSFAVTNSASVPASTSVASSLTRRSSAARVASADVANENVSDVVMAAFGTRKNPHPEEARSAVSKDDISWFETAQGRLLTMRTTSIGSGKKEGPREAGLRMSGRQLDRDQAVLV